MRYMEAESALDLMESTLTWRHIAPTVPDTLAAYPFKDDDPFILDQCPHVYPLLYTFLLSFSFEFVQLFHWESTTVRQ
jgi:hypothetical protein